MTTEAKLPAIDERKAAWLERRKTRLTGTDAGKILTGQAISVWMEKMSMADDSIGTGWMQRGQRFERAVLSWYADIHQCPIEFAPPWTLRDIPGTIFAATLDARRADTLICVDAKTIAVRDLFDPQQGTGWGEEGTDRFPLQYAAQLYMQMAATGTEEAHLAVVFSYSALETFRIYRDAEIEAGLFQRLEDWWKRHIVKGECPPAEGSDVFTEYLKKHVRQASDVIRDATPEEETLALSYKALKGEESKLAGRIQEMGNALRMAIGDGAGLRSALVKVTNKKSKDSESVNWEAVARRIGMEIAMPVAQFNEIAAATMDVVPGSRRLLVTPAKESPK